MAERLLVWVSAGVLAAGVSAGSLVGAGLAAADDTDPQDVGEPDESSSGDDAGALLRSAALLGAFGGNCAAEPSAPTGPDSTQNSTPNTVLSLDGKASRGQSVGQQCMDG